MNDLTELVWFLGLASIVALAPVLVVRTLFRRRPAAPAARATHLGDGTVMVLIDLVWAGLCFLVCFNTAFAGATAAFIWGVIGVGGGIFLVILWGAVRHFRQAYRRPAEGPGGT